MFAFFIQLHKITFEKTISIDDWYPVRSWGVYGRTGLWFCHIIFQFSRFVAWLRKITLKVGVLAVQK